MERKVMIGHEIGSRKKRFGGSEVLSIMMEKLL